MASRLFTPSVVRALSSTTATSTPLLRQSMRGFQNSTHRMNDAASVVDTSLPLRQPIGAFRGGLFGFLLGSSLSGAAVYYYILNEYKVSNELLTEDIYALQAAVQNTHAYVTKLEEKIENHLPQAGKK